MSTLINILSAYSLPVVWALIIFPFAAALITLPYTIYNYRKYDGISVLKTIIVYSFILYMLCAFLLTVLPLPSRESVAAMERIHFNWMPFKNLIEGLEEFGFNRAVPSGIFNAALWKRYIKSSRFFQIIANVAMTVPLGIYLRYYFELDFKKTAILGFLTSLFYETVQLSGLFFIYPQPYRCPDINDLITNTLGAVIGYGITPLLTFILPTRDEIDYLSWRKGERVTLLRQFVALCVDVTVVGLVSDVLRALKIYKNTGEVHLFLGITVSPVVWMFYFIIIQYLAKGCTLGKKLLKIKVVDNDSEKTSLKGLFIRFVNIYFVYPMFFIGFFLGVCAIILELGFIHDMLFGIRTVAGWLIYLAIAAKYSVKPFIKGKCLPHEYYSKQRVITVNRSAAPEIENKNNLYKIGDE